MKIYSYVVALLVLAASVVGAPRHGGKDSEDNVGRREHDRSERRRPGLRRDECCSVCQIESWICGLVQGVGNFCDVGQNQASVCSALASRGLFELIPLCLEIVGGICDAESFCPNGDCCSTSVCTDIGCTQQDYDACDTTQESCSTDTPAPWCFGPPQAPVPSPVPVPIPGPPPQVPIAPSGGGGDCSGIGSDLAACSPCDFSGEVRPPTCFSEPIVSSISDCLDPGYCITAGQCATPCSGVDQCSCSGQCYVGSTCIFYTRTA